MTQQTDTTSAQSTVRLADAELEPMRSAMRDVQVSTADYYRLTSGFVSDPVEYTTPIRSAVAFIQKLNDVMSQKLSSDDYAAIFADRLSRNDPGARTIEAFRYVRNVGQHLLYPVIPENGRVVGNNLGLGFRTSSHWARIPQDVHDGLHLGTQARAPHYEDLIAERPTLDPLLTACRFFAEVCPQLVHRDETGEWTGFPLRVQWGTSEQIHPEEPRYDREDPGASEERILGWLGERPPGGDHRWIAGKMTTPSGAVTYGLTFRYGVSYLGFSEPAAQIRSDIEMGYRYWRGLPDGNLVTEHESPDRTGATFSATVLKRDLHEWAVVENGEGLTGLDHCHWGDPSGWTSVIRKSTDLTIRKAERLNAWYPIWR